MSTSHRTTSAASLLALAGFAVSLASAGPASAQTPCAKWEVFGRWTAIQGHYRVVFHLNQQGANVYGIGAVVDEPDKSVFMTGRFGSSTEGRVTGTVRGNAVELQTTWGGVYVGTIDATGRIDGFTYDRRDSTSNASWFSNRRMACTANAEAPSAAPAATPPRPAPVSQGSDVVPSSRNSGVGSVFRTGAAPTPAPVPTPAFSEGPSIYCKPGFVWRVARPSDLVCVTPKSRDRVAAENATARNRVQPGGGAYGPNTCRSGYVWREAFPGDLVCVSPTIRELVAKENGLAALRTQ